MTGNCTGGQTFFKLGKLKKKIQLKILEVDSNGLLKPWISIPNDTTVMAPKCQNRFMNRS